MKSLTNDMIREHLCRLLKTAPFSDSVVLTRFLTFIVNETLEGRSHELKEYTIAINALKKDADFNPQIDSIVRIHAGRLRRALKEYYYEKGRDEKFQIVVPKGSYVPSFQENPAGTSASESVNHVASHLTISKNASSKNKASLAIFPFDNIGGGEIHHCFVKGLSVYLSTCLTNDPNVSVVSYYSTNRIPDKLHDIREAGLLLNASFILTGCVQIDKHLRIHILLNACDTGEQLWGTTFERKEVEKVDLFSLQEEVVNKVTGSIDSVINSHLRQIPEIPVLRNKAVYESEPVVLKNARR